MPDREKVIKGLECCCTPTTYDCKNRCPYTSLYEPGNGLKNCMAALLPDALELLKEQEDLGAELTNAVELIHKKNKRIKKLLKEQEPKKIIRKQMSYEHPDGAITYYAEWHCPHCNKVVQKGFDSPWLKYCFNCGKPILWD